MKSSDHCLNSAPRSLGTPSTCTMTFIGSGAPRCRSARSAVSGEGVDQLSGGARTNGSSCAVARRRERPDDEPPVRRVLGRIALEPALLDVDRSLAPVGRPPRRVLEQVDDVVVAGEGVEAALAEPVVVVDRARPRRSRSPRTGWRARPVRRGRRGVCSGSGMTSSGVRGVLPIFLPKDRLSSLDLLSVANVERSMNDVNGRPRGSSVWAVPLDKSI